MFRKNLHRTKHSMIVVIIAVTIFLLMLAFFVVRSSKTNMIREKTASYVVPEKAYQLRDASYVVLGFDIVVSKDKFQEMKEIIETNSSSNVFESVGVVLSLKKRQDLIRSMQHKKDFAFELENVIKETVLSSFNGKIKIKDILVADFVTQLD